jgi:hypothetical protein
MDVGVLLVHFLRERIAIPNFTASKHSTRSARLGSRRSKSQPPRSRRWQGIFEASWGGLKISRLRRSARH